VRDHTSCHLTDGAIDLALIKYDSEESAESRAAGIGPCIHHFGIEVDDMKVSAAELAKYGCEIISAPGVIPIKFRAPGGTVAEISPKARYKQAKD
jgi:lactoylglutathione lyase